MDSSKRVIFNLPAAYVKSDLVSNATPDVLYKIIMLGEMTYKYGKEQLINLDNNRCEQIIAEIKRNHEKELIDKLDKCRYAEREKNAENLKKYEGTLKKYEENEKKMRDEINEKKSIILSLQKNIDNEVNSAINKIQAEEYRKKIDDEAILKETYDRKLVKKEDSYRKLEDKISDLRIKNNTLQFLIDTHKKTIDNEVLSAKLKTMDEERKKYDKKLSEYKQEMDVKYNNRLNEIRENVDILKNKFTTNHSTNKGYNGEEFVLEMLRNEYPNCIIKDVHGATGKGDIVFKSSVDSHSIMLEVKNIKKSIPQKDVDKFKADMISNKEYKGGIIISLDNVSFNGGFNTKLEVCDGRPILYLTNCFKFTKLITVGIQCINYIVNRTSGGNKNEELVDVINYLFTSAQANSKLINKIRLNISKGLKDICDLNESVDKDIDKMSEYFSKHTGDRIDNKPPDKKKKRKKTIKPKAVEK